jgi:SAM-dependent MidA family methyltransferase
MGWLNPLSSGDKEKSRPRLGMEPQTRHNALVEVLRGEASGGVVPFVRLVEVALYHPVLGYYRQDKARVGKSDGTDFTTATALGPMFGDLLAAAAETLVGDIKNFDLIEVGAEPGQTHFSSVQARFKGLKTFRLGAEPKFEGPTVLFANELLDAQPFHRFIFQGGQWRELGVRVDGAELSVESLKGFSSGAAEEFLKTLPQSEEGWILDVSLAAEVLVDRLLQSPWRGAVVFFDYGKTLAQCLESAPAGTARSYYQHQLSGNILNHLGSQDLTCHVLWDRLEPLLVKHGFKSVRLDRQEAFWVKHAGAAMERIAQSGDGEAVGRLRALTHPAHFGAKFQVLHGIR